MGLYTGILLLWLTGCTHPGMEVVGVGGTLRQEAGDSQWLQDS